MKKVCLANECNNVKRIAAYCLRHYRIYVLGEKPRKHGGSNKGHKKVKDICKFNGCEIIAMAKGFCGTHYQRLFRHGSPSINYIRKYRTENIISDNVINPEKRYHATTIERECISDLNLSYFSFYEIDDFY